MTDAETKVDCYGDNERGGMVLYQNWKDRNLRPLLAWLTRCGISPDIMTLISTVVGLAFVPIYFWSPVAAFTVMFIHLVLDGVDGPLARFTNSASQAGSFVDTAGDQVVVVATTMALMVPLATPPAAMTTPVLGIVSGTLYCLLYTIVVAFAMIRNALGVPYPWVFRPRWIVSIWLVMDYALFQPSNHLPRFFHSTLDLVTWICNILLGILTVTGFLAIRRALQPSDSPTDQ